MKESEKIKLFLVDDDRLFLKLLEIELLENADFDIMTFPTGEMCIQNLYHHPDVIILDYFLNSIEPNAMNGLVTLDRIKVAYPDIPVVMLSSQDKIEIAVQCMHHKAFDYVVKSETALLRIQKIITSIFSQMKLEKKLNWYMDRM